MSLSQPLRRSAGVSDRQAVQLNCQHSPASQSDNISMHPALRLFNTQQPNREMGGGVLTEQESTSKQLHSQCLLGVTSEPLDCVCVCARETCAFCVPVCTVSTRRLQPAGPCGTHLTGEQRRLSAERGGKLRAPLALENRQEGSRAAGEDVGSRQKGRAAGQT